MKVATAAAAILIVMTGSVTAWCRLAQPDQSSANAASADAGMQAQTVRPGLDAQTRGDLLMARGQYQAAIDAYRAGPRESAVLWNKMGIAWHHLYAIDQAKIDYERALALDPHFGEAENNLGAVYFAERDYKQAEHWYRRALKVMPNSAVIYSNLGTDYFARGKFARGLQAYSEAMRIDSSVFENNSALVSAQTLSPAERARQDYCLAELFAQQGNRERALDYLRRALNEGFNDRRQLMGDQMLAGVRSTPEFARIMAEEKLQR